MLRCLTSLSLYSSSLRIREEDANLLFLFVRKLLLVRAERDAEHFGQIMRAVERALYVAPGNEPSVDLIVIRPIGQPLVEAEPRDIEVLRDEPDRLRPEQVADPLHSGDVITVPQDPLGDLENGELRVPATVDRCEAPYHRTAVRILDFGIRHAHPTQRSTLRPRGPCSLLLPAPAIFAMLRVRQSACGYQPRFLGAINQNKIAVIPVANYNTAGALALDLKEMNRRTVGVAVDKLAHSIVDHGL